MVAWRTNFCVAILALMTGCGGQNASPSKSDAVTTDSGKPATASAESSTPAKGTDAPADSGMPDKSASADTQEPSEPPFQLEDGFTLLTFADFEAFGAEAATWEPTPEGMKCTGKPRGYLYSKQSFQNFTLRVDYRFPRPKSLQDDAKFKGNTGFLMYITGEHKLWPVSLEVQGKFVQMAAIKENGGAQPVTATDDDAARQKARRPVGQWNSIEIVSTNGVLAVALNGVPISKCEPDFLSEGLIGIQSEDHPFEVRRLRIRPD